MVEPPQMFSLNSAVVLRSEPQYYGTYAAFDYIHARTVFLSETEFKALEYISKQPAEVTEISKETGMNYKACEKFLKRMVESGHVHMNGTGQKPLERVNINPELYGKFTIPFLSAPTSVDVFITSRCNLRCVHCFSNSGEEKVNELSAKELESVFDQLEKVGIFEVRINGGEPLLHSEIDRIIEVLKDKKFRKVIITNGILLNEEKIERLHDAGIIPTVSLDDSKAEEHDLFTGVKGSFNHTVEALLLLQRKRVQYGINCCLHKRNLGRCKEIIDLAVKFGAYRIAFLDLKVVGRMKSHQEWVPSHKEYQEAMLNLTVARFKYRKKIDVPLDTFLYCHPLEESIQEAKRGYISCQAGKNRLSIDSEGAVYPCNLVISDPEWNMGNIKERKIWDIWFSDKWSFFRGDVRIDDLKSCVDCKSLKRCKYYHCRLHPYATYGDPYGPHPKCS